MSAINVVLSRRTINIYDKIDSWKEPFSESLIAVSMQIRSIEKFRTKECKPRKKIGKVWAPVNLNIYTIFFGEMFENERIILTYLTRFYSRRKSIREHPRFRCGIVKRCNNATLRRFVAARNRKRSVMSFGIVKINLILDWSYKYS